MDDIVSIESVQPLDQLSFWCLTVSTLLKLVAMGVTIFTLPFNEWVLLHPPNSNEALVIMRGISGSDCVFRHNMLHCVRWKDDADKRSSFWTKQGLSDANMEMPGTVHRALFSLVLMQLFLFLLDLGATLVMCCRYRTQKDESTREKRVSLTLSAVVLFIYLLVAITVLLANNDFMHSLPPFESCLGTAFKLYCGMALLYTIGCALVHISRMMALRSAGEDIWKDFRCNGMMERIRGRKRNAGAADREAEEMQMR